MADLVLIVKKGSLDAFTDAQDFPLTPCRERQRTRARERESDYQERSFNFHTREVFIVHPGKKLIK